MKQKSLNDAKEYLRKHQLFAAKLEQPPANDLGLVVVIPAYNEFDIQPLESLSASVTPGISVEIIVVFNAARGASPDIKQTNLDTARRIQAFCLPTWMKLHVLEYNDLADSQAGVGLARKIGMDLAVDRFVQAGRSNGLIASLDADCRVSENYLLSIIKFFQTHSACPGATVYFEHQSDFAHSAIMDYELFLRCYVYGLRCGGYPAAFYTIGSCMVVRARDYARRGGMNRRQAGEDFYFLHKLRALGPIGEIRTCAVYPSSRSSDRTPFGTGNVVSKNQPQLCYAPEVFLSLGALMKCVDALRDVEPMSLSLPNSVKQFCSSEDFLTGLNIVRRNTASIQSFRKRFFQWFDGLRVLKFIHFLSDGEYPRVPVRDAAVGLLKQMDFEVDEAWDSQSLLRVFRRLDRTGPD